MQEEKTLGGLELVNRGRVRVAVQVVSFRPKYPGKNTIYRFADTKRMAHRTLSVGDYKESKPYRISVNAHRRQVGHDVRGTVGGVMLLPNFGSVVRAGDSGVSLVSVLLSGPEAESGIDFLRHVFYTMSSTVSIARKNDSELEEYYLHRSAYEGSTEDRATSFFNKGVGLLLGMRNLSNPYDTTGGTPVVESLALTGPLDVMKDVGQVVDEFGLGIDESGLLPRFPMTPVVLLDPKNCSSDEEFNQCLSDAREVAQWLSSGSSWYGIDVCRHLKEECMCYDCLNQTGRTGIRMSDLF